MTKTIFGKKLLLIATITVLVTGLMMSATFNDAEAKKEPKAPKAPSMKELKCKDNVGSFVSFGILGPGGSWGPFVSTGESKCKSLGDAAFTSVTRITGAAGISGAPNCIELVAGPGAGSLTPDGYGISKKGFFTYDLGTMEQCFFDASGGIPTTAGFCGLATDTHTSTVTGTFIITDGLIKGAPVTAGSGMLSSVVDHCAGGTAPNGDSVITTLTGTITY